MKTLITAASLSILLSSGAFADDVASKAGKDGITVFPPITQTLSYTYSKAITKPAANPAAGTLALAPIYPPITDLIAESHSRPLHSAIH